MDSPIKNALREAEWVTSNLPIRLFGDPALTQVCQLVTDDEISSGQAKQWADQLIDFLGSYRTKLGVGRGLAANQLGISKRLVLVWLASGPEIYLNPQLLSATGQGVYPESCISSASLVLGDVVRAWEATVSYTKLSGERITISPDSIHTRILLHELDHLEGLVCTDKYRPGTIRMATGDPDEILKPKLVRLK